MPIITSLSMRAQEAWCFDPWSAASIVKRCYQHSIQRRNDFGAFVTTLLLTLYFSKRVAMEMSGPLARLLLSDSLLLHCVSIYTQERGAPETVLQGPPSTTIFSC